MQNDSPKPSLDDVEHLTRGKPTRSKIGSIFTGHRLTHFERLILERAKANGFLEVTEHQRDNVINIYEKWCQVKDIYICVLKKRADLATITLWWREPLSKKKCSQELLLGREDFAQAIEHARVTQTLIEIESFPLAEAKVFLKNYFTNVQ